ncbi:uncharacterized protein LOC135222431 [Macrobrachium nipponense]|uniref:uncharacterized protein LOC135222431 n=1 Tax=Macrobrachium nipponense TaxID=159736 RepID=UPI0030C898F8
MVVHLFSVKSSGSCVNYTLCHTTEEHGHKYCNEASEAIMKNFYVDNLIKAHDDKERLKMMMVDMTSLCADGCWHLNQWTSSNWKLQSVIPESERDTSFANLGLSRDELPVERSLGIAGDELADHEARDVITKEDILFHHISATDKKWTIHSFIENKWQAYWSSPLLTSNKKYKKIRQNIEHWPS